jgi:hypothetical protein
MISLPLYHIFFCYLAMQMYALYSSPTHQAWHNLPDAMHIITNKETYGTCCYEHLLVWWTRPVRHHSRAITSHGLFLKIDYHNGT